MGSRKNARCVVPNNTKKARREQKVEEKGDGREREGK